MDMATPIETDRPAQSPGRVTRADLAEAVRQRLGVSSAKSVDLVELVLAEIRDAIVSGEQVKLRSFGSFNVRSKNERPGRNPKTGVAAPVSARLAVTFKASGILRSRLNNKHGIAEEQ